MLCHGLCASSYASPRDYFAYTPIDCNPSNISPHGMGIDILNFFNLAAIPNEDLSEMMQLLSQKDQNW